MISYETLSICYIWRESRHQERGTGMECEYKKKDRLKWTLDSLKGFIEVFDLLVHCKAK